MTPTMAKRPTARAIIRQDRFMLVSSRDSCDASDMLSEETFKDFSNYLNTCRLKRKSVNKTLKTGSLRGRIRDSTRDFKRCGRALEALSPASLLHPPPEALPESPVRRLRAPPIACCWHAT